MMKGKWLGLMFLVGMMGLVWGVGGNAAAQQPTEGSGAVYLPIVYAAAAPVVPPTCNPNTGQVYSQGTAWQFDLDNPVRLAWNHADKNIELRSYSSNDDPNLARELINYGSDDPTQPPQLATIFNPHKVPALTGFYRIHNWNWAPSPAPGTRGGPSTWPPVTVIGLATTMGELLHVPHSGYDIGAGMEVIVIFADEDSVTLRYSREDSAGSQGYTLHLDNICTDPNLLALYNALDNASGPRYQYVPPAQRPHGYNLPQLPAGQPLGVARGTEIRVGIVDSGTFMDPRSCNEWWQIRPGYGGSCPPALLLEQP